MRHAIRFLAVAAVVCGFAATARATANYVYHEASKAVTGGSCGQYRDVLTVTPPADVVVRFKVEYQYYTDNVRLYYTTDGSAPAGAFGVTSGTTTALAASYACTFGDPVVDVATATIPAQALGTTVKYVVSAWHGSGGVEIFANSGEFINPCTESSCATVFTYTVEPARVDLLDFRAARVDGGVTLAWRTGSETACGAFQLLRCDRATSACATPADHAALPGILLPCHGDAAGASYDALDSTAAATGAYSYYLQELETGGGVHEYGPALIDPAAATPGADPTAGPPAGADAPVASGCAVAAAPAGLAPLLLLPLLARRRRAR